MKKNNILDIAQELFKDGRSSTHEESKAANDYFRKQSKTINIKKVGEDITNKKIKEFENIFFERLTDEVNKWLKYELPIICEIAIFETPNSLKHIRFIYEKKD